MHSDTVIVVDGMNLFHRAYHKFFHFTSKKGVPTGALFGMLFSLIAYYRTYNTNNIVICWDSRNNKRKKVNPDYKKNRRAGFSPEQLERLFDSLKMVKKCLYEFGIASIEKDGEEADDLMWLMTKLFKNNVIIVSNDKDLLQTVNDDKSITVLRPKDMYEYNEDAVLAEFGVTPKFIPHYLAICGDRGDNVRGVEGWGRVNALKILKNGDITSPKITKETYLKLMTVTQFQQFVASYKLVKLGYKQVKEYDITFKNDVDDKKIINLLKQYEIKKFNPSQIKLLSNRKFKKKLIRNKNG